MKSNELRIGNLIDRVDYICEVVGIDKDGVIVEPLNYEGERFVEQEIQPIPLTEEWLLNFGFEEKEWIDSYDNTKVTGLVKDNIWCFCYKYKEKYNATYFGRRVKTGSFDSDVWRFEEREGQKEYLHQLQNLHFALTGEELQIK